GYCGCVETYQHPGRLRGSMSCSRPAGDTRDRGSTRPMGRGGRAAGGVECGSATGRRRMPGPRRREATGGRGLAREPLVQDGDVVLLVPGDDVGEGPDGHGIVVGDPAPEPGFLIQAAEEEEVGPADELELPDEAVHRTRVEPGVSDVVILVEAGQ